MNVEPYLFFEGRAEEALQFYQQKLGAKVEAIIRYKENPEPKYNPPNSDNKVMHALFRIGDTKVMASDGNCAGKPSFQGFALTINAASP
ncbi:MAG TPA: VOC family protein, partial [Burkholderiales bacterium]|nr:VOC family protein [Burkholderiales bacterium]